MIPSTSTTLLIQFCNGPNNHNSNTQFQLLCAKNEYYRARRGCADGSYHWDATLTMRRTLPLQVLRSTSFPLASCTQHQAKRIRQTLAAKSEGAASTVQEIQQNSQQLANKFSRFASQSNGSAAKFTLHESGFGSHWNPRTKRSKRPQAS